MINTYDQVKQAIAEKITARLKELDIRKLEFANIMQVTPSTVSKWLSGKHNFTMKKLMEIESKLHITFFDYYKN